MKRGFLNVLVGIVIVGALVGLSYTLKNAGTSKDVVAAIGSVLSKEPSPLPVGYGYGYGGNAGCPCVAAKHMYGGREVPNGTQADYLKCLADYKLVNLNNPTALKALNSCPAVKAPNTCDKINNDILKAWNELLALRERLAQLRAKGPLTKYQQDSFNQQEERLVQAYARLAQYYRYKCYVPAPGTRPIINPGTPGGTPPYALPGFTY